MIDVSLAYIRKMLDQYLSIHLGIDEGNVVLNSVVTDDGARPQKNQNKVVITLINLEYETNRQFYGGMQRDGNQFNRVNPPVFFNVDMMLSSGFDDYGESLKFLTACIAFFQENLSFNIASHPDMPAGLETLKFEIENSPSEKTYNVWMALGAKYVPSIIYKIRHVAVQSGQIKGTAAAVCDTSAGVAA
jgi:hypothetical protein